MVLFFLYLIVMINQLVMGGYHLVSTSCFEIGGYPPNHPILIVFSLTNHPFLGSTPHLWKPPYISNMFISNISCISSHSYPIIVYCTPFWWYFPLINHPFLGTPMYGILHVGFLGASPHPPPPPPPPPPVVTSSQPQARRGQLQRAQPLGDPWSTAHPALEDHPRNDPTYPLANSQKTDGKNHHFLLGYINYKWAIFHS